MNKVHTLADLILALQAFGQAYPDMLDQPAGFTSDRGEALKNGDASIWFVGNVIVDPDGGGALITRLA